VHVHIHNTKHSYIKLMFSQNIRACHYRNESRSRNGWMSFPEAVKTNIAFSITVTAISSNDNCTMLLISLDNFFRHSDKNSSSLHHACSSSFSSALSLSLYPPALFQLSEPGEISSN